MLAAPSPLLIIHPSTALMSPSRRGRPRLGRSAGGSPCGRCVRRRGGDRLCDGCGKCRRPSGGSGLSRGGECCACASSARDRYAGPSSCGAGPSDSRRCLGLCCGRGYGRGCARRRGDGGLVAAATAGGATPSALLPRPQIGLGKTQVAIEWQGCCGDRSHSREVHCREQAPVTFWASVQHMVVGVEVRVRLIDVVVVRKPEYTILACGVGAIVQLALDITALRSLLQRRRLCRSTRRTFCVAEHIHRLGVCLVFTPWILAVVRRKLVAKDHVDFVRKGRLGRYLGPGRGGSGAQGEERASLTHRALGADLHVGSPIGVALVHHLVRGKPIDALTASCSLPVHQAIQCAALLCLSESRRHW
mmetsp:Transcript_40254/g.101096  ORF Transcript_40254/g.101096 Transcript_40254/m.101096 type:complete len:361 (-) Transcript_40254:1088-2170(-)